MRGALRPVRASTQLPPIRWADDVGARALFPLLSGGIPLLFGRRRRHRDAAHRPSPRRISLAGDRPPSPLPALRLGFPAVVVAAEGTFFQDSTHRVDQFVRAYSSIGQSPRLITGPFLVRTQVGPPLTTTATRWARLPSPRAARSAAWCSSAPLRRLAVECSALCPLQGAS